MKKPFGGTCYSIVYFLYYLFFYSIFSVEFVKMKITFGLALFLCATLVHANASKLLQSI